MDELFRVGLEVALPLRDKGIDLIAYADTGEAATAFTGRPIQMKAVSAESFSIDSKDTAFPDLILAYVWHVSNGDTTVTFALPRFEKLLRLPTRWSYTQTESWRRGYYVCYKNKAVGCAHAAQKPTSHDARQMTRDDRRCSQNIDELISTASCVSEVSHQLLNRFWPSEGGSPTGRRDGRIGTNL